jgi:hypothetical protein
MKTDKRVKTVHILMGFGRGYLVGMLVLGVIVGAIMNSYNTEK